MEGEEAGDLGDTLEPEKEKSSLKVKKNFYRSWWPMGPKPRKARRIGPITGIRHREGSESHERNQAR
jgi:hypothetical protein